MNKIILPCFIFFLIVSTSHADLFVVTANNNDTFTPSNITVEVGDTVRWMNMGGNHNVREESSPPLWRNGDPSSSNWTYNLVIDLPPATYHYFCEQHAPDMSGSITVEEPQGVCDDLCRPTTATDFGVLSGYPNPFNPSTKIVFSIERAQHVRLAVYNALGREVALLVNRSLDTGNFEVPFDGTHYPSGVYFAHLRTGTRTVTTKLLLLK